MSKTNVMHDEMPKYSPEDLKTNIILKLRNFRVYNNCEVRIPFNSTTLISGPSGIGKTSILEAFMFILYDGVSKPEKFGTKTVWGWLYINDLIVYRQKAVALLKVWRKEKDSIGNSTREITREYTNSDAQAIINETYGPESIFVACSYLKQHESSAFLGSADADKLQIIKDVAFKGSELDETKEPIKAATKSLQEQYTSVKGQLDMVIRNLSDFDNRNPQIARVQIPDKSEDVLKKVQELRLKMDELDKEFEIAVQREANAKVFKDQADQAKTKQGILLGALNQLNINAFKARLQELDAKLKEFSNVSFDAEKIAKVHIFKQWNGERVQLQTKAQAIGQEIAQLEAIIGKIFPNIIKLQDGEKIDMVGKLKIRLQEISSIQNELSMLLGQIGYKTLNEAKTALAQAEVDYNNSKETEAKVRKDFEEAKIRADAEAEAARAKMEEERERLERDKEQMKEQMEKDREREKERAKTENDKVRLSNKMKCPQCQTSLIVGEDGKHLERSPDAPTGIGAMLGEGPKLPPIAQITLQQNTIPSNHPPETKPATVPKQPVFNLQPSNPILSAVTPATPSPPTSTPLVTTPKVTMEDLTRAIANLANATNKRERIKVIVEACEERSKITIDSFKADSFKGDVVKNEDGVQLLPIIIKYLEVKKQADVINETVNEHERKKPEEITEKVADTREKEQCEAERASIVAKIDQYDKISKEIENEEMKHKQFSQMMMEMLQQLNNTPNASFEIKKQKQILQSQVDQLMYLNSASELLAQRTILEKSMREKIAEAQRIEAKYMAIQRCFTKAVEAERIYLQTAVDKINVLLGQSLQKLFPDKPISVEISTTKALKTKPNQVSQRFDIKIFYNDSEYDSSKQLSGGERDRVSLALTLAMSATFGSPILFLDETLSSLDAELKSEAVMLLKDLCKTKTCVVISHEETEGLYDNVLKLKAD